MKYTAGAGLGLFIAKAFVDLHRGTIGIDSRDGEGAAVTVRVPVRVALSSEP